MGRRSDHGYKGRVARRRRLDATLRRLRRGAEPAGPARTPPAPGADAAAAPPERPTDAQLTIGELGAGRREAAIARLRELRSRAADAGAAVERRWHGLPTIARQRIAALAIVAALAAIVAWVLIPAAPCGAPGGGSCAVEDDAIALVPADAIAYAHVDAGGPELAAASAYAERLPLLSGLLLGSVSAVAGERVDFGTEVAPWAGDELALAVLPSLPTAATVTMIEADDPAAARRFADRIIGPARTERLGGLSVALGGRGTAAALVDGFLLIGDEAGVKAMIEGGDDGNLSSAAAAAGIDDLPTDRFAYGYLSGDGARALLARDHDLAPLDALINARGSDAVTAALSFDGGLASLTIRSAQDPDLAGEHPSLLAALPRFAPALDADVGPDALAYLGLGDAGAGLESLLALARRRAPALTAPLERAAGDLGAAGGDDLPPLLGGEAALSIEPVAAQRTAPTPGVLAPAGVPYVSLIADGVDAAAAGELARLRRPLAAALAPRRARFEPVQIAGVEARSLTVSANVELTYATYDDRLVVATKPIGIAQARAGGDGLADSEGYRAVTARMPADVSLLAYLDLRGLLSLGEQIGLAEDPVYVELAPDLRALQAAALSVDDSGAELRTDVSVAIGPPPDAAAPGAD